jgi:glycosyltransferase involved in cell wall biosynthesis
MSKYFFNKIAYHHIREQLACIRPDVVHLHHNRFYTYSALKALKDEGIPTVQTVHDYTMLCPSQYYPDLYYDTPGTKTRRHNCQLICSQGSCLPWTSRLGHPFAHDRKRRRVRQKIGTFIAPSSKLKDYLERAGFEGVCHLPFFVEEGRWSFDNRRDVRHVVLFVGRVETNKGIHLLIDSVNALSKELPDIRLIIAGDGTQRAPITERLRRENMEGYVELAGFVDYARIGEYYARANVLVVPSLDMEQFGLIGIEGLASGTAVLGSNTGGIPEWCLHERTGLLFDPEHPEGLTQELRRLLTDPQLTDRLTHAGMAHVREVYHEGRHFEGLLSLYNQAAPVS